MLIIESKEVLWAKEWGTRFSFAKDPLKDLIPYIPPSKFPRVLLLCETEQGQLYRTLNRSGFTVTVDGRRPSNTNEFAAIIAEYPPEAYDLIMFACFCGMASNGGALMACLDIGKPFILYSNLDGLPVASLRYEYLEKYANVLTLFLDRSRAFARDGETGAKDIYQRYWLGGYLDMPQFVFTDAQTNLFDVLGGQINER